MEYGFLSDYIRDYIDLYMKANIVDFRADKLSKGEPPLVPTYIMDREADVAVRELDAGLLQCKILMQLRLNEERSHVVNMSCVSPGWDLPSTTII